MKETQVILVMKYLVDQVKEVIIFTLQLLTKIILIYTIVPGVVDILENLQEEVMWNPPSQPNGIITGYQVIYSVYQIPSTKMMSDVLDNTITKFSIENLSE